MPLPPWERSVLLEAVRERLFGPRALAMDAVAPSRRVERIPDEAVTTFARNVRTILALARGGGARLVLVTQPLRVRVGRKVTDLRDLERWIPGLEGRVAGRELERLSDVLRGLSAEPTCW